MKTTLQTRTLSAIVLAAFGFAAGVTSANTTNRAYGWGGLVGDGTPGYHYVPVPVSTSGALAGKTVVALAPGRSHTMGLCSDGTLAAWGQNVSGQLGDNTTNIDLVPVPVNRAAGVSALYGKTVVAVAAGAGHSLALCSDGTVAGWGGNPDGELGDNTTTEHHAPTAVNTAPGSALYGKSVVAIAAGNAHNLALCSDGTVAAWGRNYSGELGDNTSGAIRILPVAVNTAAGISALHDKTVAAIAAGGYYSLALCTDGTFVGWGANFRGQLGDNTGTQRNAPVLVGTATNSVIHGKVVVAFAAGGEQSVAVCSDGTVAAWGRNWEGELGDNHASGNVSPVPVAVNTASGVSALFGKRVICVAAGAFHSLALCSDGTAVGWGMNESGQLGDNSSTQRYSPVAVNTASLATGERFTRVFSGPAASHSVALVAEPPVLPITLSTAVPSGSGSFQFGFSTSPGALFTVLTATNPLLPLGNWVPLSGVTEVTPGQYQFTDPQATNSSRRFYLVRSP